MSLYELIQDIEDQLKALDIDIDTTSRSLEIDIGTVLENTWSQLPNVLTESLSGLNADLSIFRGDIIHEIEKNVPIIDFDTETILQGIGDYMSITQTNIGQGLTTLGTSFEDYMKREFDELNNDLVNYSGNIKSSLLELVPDINAKFDISLGNLRDSIDTNLTDLSKDLVTFVNQFNSTAGGILAGLQVIFNPLELILHTVGNLFMTRFEKLFTFTPESLEAVRQQADKLYLEQSKKLLDEAMKSVIE